MTVSRTEEQLALALEASGLALWDLDVASQQVYLNAGWAQMLGLPAGETHTTSAELMAMVPDEDQGRVMAALKAALSGEAAEYRVEHRLRRPDGREIWIVSHGRVVERDAAGRAKRMLGTNRDISERVAATRALQKSEARFKQAFESSAVGIALVAPDGSFQSVNPALRRMLGYSEAEFLATTFRALTHPEDLEENQALVNETLSGKRDGYQYEKRFMRKDGRPVWVQVHAALVRDEIDRPVQLICQVLDVTARREAEARVRELALHDALTGLPNNRLLEDRLQQAFAAARRDKSAVGVLFVDLDGFKPVNDRHGHAAGDALLICLARRGEALLRGADTLARVGGDEFVVLLPGAGRAPLEQAAARLLAAFQDPCAVEGGQVQVGASIGAAVAPEGTGSPELLLRAADQAMYEAKAAGKNSIRFSPMHQ